MFDFEVVVLFALADLINRPGQVLTRLVGRMMIKAHRRSGDRFMGMDLLYLTTVGARTGQRRQTPLARFPDGDRAWLVVASAAERARNPLWYSNLAAHPDQAWIEIAGQQLRATAEQLEGERREEAWQRIIESQPRYAGYQRKTDRVLPIIRLSPAHNPGPPSTASPNRHEQSEPHSCGEDP